MTENTEDSPKTEAEILEIALAKEQASYKYYDRMMKNTTVPFLRELLEGLRDDESRHIHNIRRAIEKLGVGRG